MGQHCKGEWAIIVVAWFSLSPPTARVSPTCIPLLAFLPTGFYQTGWFCRETPYMVRQLMVVVTVLERYLPSTLMARILRTSTVSRPPSSLLQQTLMDMF